MHRFKFQILPVLFISGLNLNAEPFLAPEDPFLRHEIRLLQDYGSIHSTISTWPLSLGEISRQFDDKKNRWGHNLLGITLSRESTIGFSAPGTSFGMTDNRVTSRAFGSEPRAAFQAGFNSSWMGDRFAARLCLSSLHGVESDWKGRKEEGIALDGSYLAARLGNWSGSLGKIDRWWGPGWDGSLVLSTNARPLPAISIDRIVSEPFETPWLSWIGSWSLHSFIGRMEKERHVPKPYLWGIRGEFSPSPIDGLEIGFFRMMQLGGVGRPESLKTWVDAFFGQDNYGANSRYQDKAKEPGNQLAGLDIRWRPFNFPFALYGQVAGEDEDKFLPNALFFQYGLESWTVLENSTLRFYVEYTDLTSTWWTSDPNSNNVTYGHSIYKDGFRYRGRTIGHWADQDSQILSIGGILLAQDGIGWGGTLRTGKLNEDGNGESSVSDACSTALLSLDIYNSRVYHDSNLEIKTSLGWERLVPSSSLHSRNGLTSSLLIQRTF